MKELEFTNKPKHGVVRELRKQRDKILSKLAKSCMDLVKKGKIKESMNFEEAIDVIAKEKPDLLLEYQKEMEEFDQLATISFATNRVWRWDELDELTEDEFWELYEKSKEVLGGTAEDFLSKYDKIGFSRMKLNQQS